MKKFVVLVLVLISLVAISGVASAEHGNIGGIGASTLKSTGFAFFR